MVVLMAVAMTVKAFICLLFVGLWQCDSSGIMPFGLFAFCRHLIPNNSNLIKFLPLVRLQDFNKKIETK